MSDFGARVVMGSSLLAIALATTAGALVRVSVGVGIAIGAAVAIVNFVSLARVVSSLGNAFTGARPRSRLTLVALARYGVTFAALAVPVAAGWAHPVPLAIGLTAMPVALLVHGLRDARAVV